MNHALIFLYLWLPLGGDWSRIDWEWWNSRPGSSADGSPSRYVPFAGLSLWLDWLKRQANW